MYACTAGRQHSAAAEILNRVRKAKEATRNAMHARGAYGLSARGGRVLRGVRSPLARFVRLSLSLSVTCTGFVLIPRPRRPRPSV